MSASIEMPRYKSHKEVWALKIKEVVCHAHADPSVSIDEFAKTDEVWGDRFARRALDACRASLHRSMSCNQNLILIEVGVIRGSNYRNVVDLIQRHYPQHKVVTTTLFENKGSAFKSDFVVEYYNDTTQDLTFWWETYNKHWQSAEKGDLT